MILPLGAPLALAVRAPHFVAVAQAPRARLRFEVSGTSILSPHRDGRLFVVIDRGGAPEPRLEVGDNSRHGAVTLGQDVKGFGSGDVRALTAESAIGPMDDLAQLPAGDYVVQALFDTSTDVRDPNGPGCAWSEPLHVRLDPAAADTVKLAITHLEPAESLPPDTTQVKYLRYRSAMLSAFFHHDFYLRAGVILPPDFYSRQSAQYPLWVHIGGFATRFTIAGRMVTPGNKFADAFNAMDAPRFVVLVLDGAGPYGDPYQVNSANNGPYGDAVTQELIPEVEKRFRCIGKPWARVLDGGSTGGWVSLALQIFYPDFFAGTWSYSPDPVDFHAYQLIDIYREPNAYTNEHGEDRPGSRDVDGDVRTTMRDELNSENALGFGDSYVASGDQWGSWNAVFSPRAADGRPEPLWNPRTGVIRPEIAEQWKKYDLREVLQQNWKTLAPKLRGKIHIWVGEADNYFLNNAVHLLDAFLSSADPPFDGHIEYGPGKGHTWCSLTLRQIMDQMAAAVAKGRPAGN